jgi:MFS family permease
MERWRSLCAGILETAGNTFLLLIATRYFELGAWHKAAVAGGTSVGLLLSPLVVNTVQRFGWQPTVAVARLLQCGGLLCLAMAVYAHPWLYVGGAVLAMATTSAAIPLMTQVYQDNYPPDSRGRLYSRAFMLRIAAAMAFAWMGGQLLEPSLGELSRIVGVPLFRVTALLHKYADRWRVLLVLFAGAFAMAAWAVSRIPSRPIPPAAGSHPLHGLRYIGEDRLFRQALIAWMLMGFANLAMLPMRIEYLGNPKHGLARSASEIALLTLVIPNAARLVMSPVWGRLFDRMNFFSLRVVLNIGFALGIAAFFTSESTWGLVLGALIYGVSNAGGDVAWGLWVTKIAPADRVADYMSIHTFLTGIRGVLAPVVAFQVALHMSPAAMGWIAGGMILAAAAMLVPEALASRPQKKGEVLTEEVAD